MSVLLLATIPGWHEETDEDGSIHDVKPFPSRRVDYSIGGFLGAAVFLGFISSLWQHTAAVAAATTTQHMAYGTVKTHVGVAAMTLTWVSLALYLFSFLGMMILRMSVRILDRLTD